MSNMIKMSHEEIISISKTYTEASSTIDDTLGKLKQAQSQLASVWEGESFMAFEEQFTLLEPKVQQFSNLMLDVNKQLTDIANTIADTDAQLGNIVKKNSGSF